ncbi:hypothetical protein Cgig2_009139 [Carnegiea gigantea]|uniref:MOSC domain-containing protein n=1 Tax=Carnegiea gigantea TaxID=171969 RepID=A0A9Q1JXT1_9CARY|nr:hypothetical protein Cgig2_009139 [Carnegiea gigantea]
MKEAFEKSDLEYVTCSLRCTQAQLCWIHVKRFPLIGGLLSPSSFVNHPLVSSPELLPSEALSLATFPRFVDFITSSFVALPSPLRHGRHLREFDIDSMKGCLREQTGLGLDSSLDLEHEKTFSNAGQERVNDAMASYLNSISVYPIKSCAGFSVDRWPLSSTGLLHDREWLLKVPSGEILTQKKAPEMSLISTFIDLSQGLLFVESPRCKTELQIPLKLSSYTCERDEIYLHDYRYEVHCYSHEVNSWFSRAIGRPCTLWRSSATKCSWKGRGGASMCRDTESPLNFVNEAQFLLISEASVSDLNDRLRASMYVNHSLFFYDLQSATFHVREQLFTLHTFMLSPIPASFVAARAEISKLLRAPAVQVSAMRFRPNLVISGREPYAEDFWRRVQIGNNYFESLGGCNRCQMINFDHRSEHIQKTSEPLATLASYRRVKCLNVGNKMLGIRGEFCLGYCSDMRSLIWQTKKWIHGFRNNRLVLYPQKLREGKFGLLVQPLKFKRFNILEWLLICLGYSCIVVSKV